MALGRHEGFEANLLAAEMRLSSLLGGGKVGERLESFAPIAEGFGGLAEVLAELAAAGGLFGVQCWVVKVALKLLTMEVGLGCFGLGFRIEGKGHRFFGFGPIKGEGSGGLSPAPSGQEAKHIQQQKCPNQVKASGHGGSFLLGRKSNIFLS